MKLLSWNVNGLRAAAKKGFSEWLFHSRADVVSIQETKCSPDQLPPELSTPTGFHAYFDSSKEKKGYSGVACFSVEEPEKIEYGLGHDTLDQEGRLITLYYKKFVLMNCYFPNGKRDEVRFRHKMDYYDAFLKKAMNLRKAGHPVIFCGDVNTAHEEIDIARPKENEKVSGFLPEERAWIDEVINSGFVDSFRHMHQEMKNAYSWWDQFTQARDRNVGWRIDYFFVSQDLVPKLKKAFIDTDTFGSDHAPVGIELDL